MASINWPEWSRMIKAWLYLFGLSNGVASVLTLILLNFDALYCTWPFSWIIKPKEWSNLSWTNLHWLRTYNAIPNTFEESKLFWFHTKSLQFFHKAQHTITVVWISVLSRWLNTSYNHSWNELNTPSTADRLVLFQQLSAKSH